MNPPTRQEFDELKAEVAKLKEQRQTEPISLSDSALLQTLVIMAGTQATDIGVLKQTAERIETKVSVAATRDQVDGRFRDMEKRFDTIAETMKLILDRLPEKE